jgi:probable phosphoglycerate mutase
VFSGVMITETTIFLVRHGETEWNRQNRMQGNRDSPLTRRGLAQAHEVKKSLENCALDQAYVSPLGRALKTAAIILKDRELDAVFSDKLREINLGPWEGKTLEEAAFSHPDEYRAFREQPDRFSLPGAETFHELQHRVAEELDSIFAKGKGKNILVVSHWMAIKVALAHYSSTPLARLPCIADPVNGGFLRLSNRDDDVFIH